MKRPFGGLSILTLTALYFIFASAGCSNAPGGNGGGGNQSSSPQSSSSSSSPSGIVHPYIYNDNFKTNNWGGQYTLIYMASACGLQMYAKSNLDMMPIPYAYFNGGPNAGVNKVFVYIDNSADYGVFPDWVKPGGLFVYNYNNLITNYPSTGKVPQWTKGVSGMDRFDRVYMPPNPDACDSNTLYQVMEFIKTNYGVANLTALVFWGHGDGWMPLNGGQTGPINLSAGHMPGAGKINQSVGINNNSGNTLYDDQIAWAISTTFGYVNYLGFDTCYMGNLENVYTYVVTNLVGNLQNAAAINLIASPGVEANIGWNYD